MSEQDWKGLCEHGFQECSICNPGFQLKDSGVRRTYESGMQREPSEGKARYDLLWLPGLKRQAEHMASGAKKYSPRNWETASTQTELERFKEAFMRHAFQWLLGETDEDHAAAICFNLWGAENCKANMEKLRHE